MRIALVQMEIVQGDIEANLAKMESFLSIAKRKRADVIVFPEYSLTGSVKGKPHLIDKKRFYRKIFSRLSKKHKIDILCGSFVENEDGKYYNTSCYFDRSGRILAAYRKINLWHSERGRLSRGNGPAVFNTRFGKAGIAICWDLTYPEIFRSMARKGARFIYVPSFWSDAGISNYPTESKNIDMLCHARALENECAIIYCNAAGRYEKGDNLIGHSQVTVPIDGAIKKISGGKEALVVAGLPQSLLEKAAKVYKIREDMQSGYLR